MTTRAFDENGKELFPVVINTICPINHAKKARQIAFDFIQSLGGNEPLELILNIELKPVRSKSKKATHIFCSRVTWTNELNSQLNWLKNQNEKWIDHSECTLKDSSEKIKNYFCTVVGETKELLNRLGLEEV